MINVLLTSGSVPALAAALDLAEVGIKVWIADVRSQLPREPVRDPGGEITTFLAELATPIAPGGSPSLGAHSVKTDPAPVLLRGRDGEWKPQPIPAPWGIPTVPLSHECINILGAGGAVRAYLDRLKPVLTIGKQENLAKLVRSRMGSQVLHLLTQPFVFERLGVDANDVDVSLLAPGLNEALTRAGSLSGGALQHLERLVARETLIAPQAGWAGLEALLYERLALYGAERLDAAIVRLEATDDGDAWIATDETGRPRKMEAIIAGVDEGIPASSELFDAVRHLRSARTREYAEISIDAPTQVDASNENTELLGIIAARDGSSWSARTRKHVDGSWTIKLAGPSPDRERPATRPEDFRAMAAELECDVRVEDVMTYIETAPYATHAERDAGEQRVEAFAQEHPSVLVCGEPLFGGELSDALAHARQRAVQLRRQLTGIAE